MPSVRKTRNIIIHPKNKTGKKYFFDRLNAADVALVFKREKMNADVARERADNPNNIKPFLMLFCKYIL